MVVEPSVPEAAGPPDIGLLLEELHGIVGQCAPHLLRLFEVFAQEARFARAWLEPGVAGLKQGDPILEIGGGLMLLSCQLVREGYSVTALEPIGEGFSHFSELQGIVLQYAGERGIAPQVMPLPVERLAEEKRFAFAFSANVMEHVENVPMALGNASRALRPGAEYRFFCPNYLFPYEPHFDIPTLLSKKLTGFVFGASIRRSNKVVDPAGVWQSLNWITVPMIQREARRIPGISVRFGRGMFATALERANNDAEFAARRAGWVRALARGMVFLRLHRLTEYLPPHVHPIIDCTLLRLPAPE